MHYLLCILTSKQMLAHAFACIRMVENDQKHKKMMKKVHFSSCIPEAHVRLTKKKEKKVCWSVIGSDSQKLVDT